LTHETNINISSDFLNAPAMKDDNCKKFVGGVDKTTYVPIFISHPYFNKLFAVVIFHCRSIQEI
jgi:hypothetical protein